MTGGWKTNRKSKTKFFIPKTMTVDRLSKPRPSRLMTFPYKPDQPFAKEIATLAPSLQDIRVEYCQEDCDPRFGASYVEYGTKNSPTIIFMRESGIGVTEAFWHEVGHIVEDRASDELRNKWKKVVERYDRKYLEAIYHIPYHEEQKNTRLVQEELFAELFMARAMGWRYARLSANPKKYIPELWAVVDEAWRNAHVPRKS